MHFPVPAMLLVGPTGAGKTPLGEALETGGLRKRRCAHFDFGEQMRRIVAEVQSVAAYSSAEIAFLRRVLQTGALLEDADFPLAERILRTFIEDRQFDDQMLLILNGLPRHIGQARALGSVASVEFVVRLICPPETVLARIAANTGGDRSTRSDDELTAIQRKLTIFDERTAPLLGYYRDRNIPFCHLDVATDTSSQQMRSMLEQSLLHVQAVRTGGVEPTSRRA